jgi:DNA repair protein RecO (recombination protein O)
MSWQAVKGEGIVLLTEPFRESDRVYIVLTKDHGKIRIFGRGAQKGKAKLAPFLEPFSVVDLEWIDGRRGATIISADRKERFLTIEKNYHLRNLAYIVNHEIDRHAREHDVHPELYEMLISWMRELDMDPIDSYTRKAFMLGGFFLQFLGHMGYQVQLQDCLVCSQRIMPLSFRWHGGKGGLVCSDCARKNDEEWHVSTLIHEDVLRLLRFTGGETDFTQLRHMRLPGGHVAEFIKVVDDLIKYHLPDAPAAPFWNPILEDFVLK